MLWIESPNLTEQVRQLRPISAGKISGLYFLLWLRD